jgi:UDP-2,3-diacylglucosamine hydrolase
MSQRVYFISDVHLGVPNGRRTPDAHQDALIAFLRHIESGNELFIVGDLFDFWFEYRSSVPTIGARVVFELYALVQRGVRVSILPGNHDIWLGSYLEDEVGLNVLSNPVELELQGKRLHVTHGDEFNATLQFKVSRAILNNPVCIRLFRLVHPDLGVALGRMMSNASDSKAQVIPRNDRAIYEIAAERLIQAGSDIVVSGHYHKGIVMDIFDGRLVVLGNWVRSDTYGVMENGQIELMRWVGDRGVPAESER